MLSPLNAAFAAIALAAAVIPLANPAQKQLSDKERFAAAFERANIELRPLDGPSDVFVYEFTPPECRASGRLVLTGYGTRAKLRDVVSEKPGTLYMSGVTLDDLDEKTLFRAYLTDQVASKTGLRQEGPWSRRLVSFAPPQECPLTLNWDGVHDPSLVKG